MQFQKVDLTEENLKAGAVFTYKDPTETLTMVCRLQKVAGSYIVILDDNVMLITEKFKTFVNKINKLKKRHNLNY